MPGLKGFFYTLAFASLALLAVLSLSFYAARGLPVPPSPPATGAVVAGIGNHFMHLGNVSFEITKEGSKTVFTARDSLPSALSSPANEVHSFESFLSTIFASRTNHNISLDVPASSYSLQPFGLSYSHDSFSKNSFLIPSNANTEAYSLRIRLGKACLAGDCGTATTGAWAWQPGGLGVSLDIRDANGNPISPGGATGYVDAASAESFQTALEGGGFLNVSIANGALRVTASGARAECVTNTTLTGAPVSQLLLPVSLSVDGISYSSIILLSN